MRFSVVCLLLFVACSEPTSVEQSTSATYPWLQYATPEEAGWSTEALEEARSFSEVIGSRAVMIVFRGHVVAAWGDVDRKFRCHSVRKSFLGALFGRALDAGVVRLDATLSDLGIDDIGRLTEMEKSAQVAHLLSSSSGVYHPAAMAFGQAEGRPERGSHAPGTFFFYNNWDFNTAGAIFEQEAGIGIFEAFEQWIAGPTGMEDFELRDTHYAYERRSSVYPGYPFRMSTRDMARFGQLYLQNGRWNGIEVVPEGWVDASTRSQIHAWEGTDYGYLWWVYPPGKIADHPDLATYTATGTGGQHIMVVPDAEVVIVHRGDTDFGSGVDGGSIWRLESMILSARDGDPKNEPRLIPLAPQPFATALPPLEYHEIGDRVSVSTAVLDAHAGLYEIAPGIVASVDRHEDFLVGWVPGDEETDLFPLSETEFFAQLEVGRLTFHRDAEGSTTHFVFRPGNGEEITGTKLP